MGDIRDVPAPVLEKGEQGMMIRNLQDMPQVDLSTPESTGSRELSGGVWVPVKLETLGGFHQRHVPTIL